MSVDVRLDESAGILHVCPAGGLRAEDFDAVAKVADPFIERSGGLRGLILEFERFPGWEDFDAMRRHFRFVRDHHRRIGKLAVVTDSVVGELGEHLADHFVAATIRHFPAGGVDAARQWIADED